MIMINYAKLKTPCRRGIYGEVFSIHSKNSIKKITYMYLRSVDYIYLYYMYVGESSLFKAIYVPDKVRHDVRTFSK